MNHALSSFFSWPDGGVWANLLASLLWGTPAFVVHHKLMRRHHEKTVREQTVEQTADLKAHIDAKLGGRQ